MTKNLPDFLSQGETARLFPVLSKTSTEGRAASILLACLSKIDELGQELLTNASGRRVGTQTQIDTYTEIVPKIQPSNVKDRPDGLIVLRSSRSGEWRAFVEVKTGPNELDAEQIERYRALAKKNDVSCVITISNQFSTSPNVHPLKTVLKKSGTPVIHWSWKRILTTADLLIDRDEVINKDQRIILEELLWFLNQEDSGVRGFDKMPGEWTKLNQHVSSRGEISKKSSEAKAVLEAWHQEISDLSLILSCGTDTRVEQRLSRKHRADLGLRQKDELDVLSNEKQLHASLIIPDAAAELDIVVDLAKRCIEVGMNLEAPDRKRASTRINWLLKQIRKEDDTPDLYVRIYWPGRSATTQHLVSDLRDDVSIANEGKEHLTPIGFYLFEIKQLGGRFSKQANFVKDLEKLVTDFYRNYGENLYAWKRSAPKLKDDGSADTSAD